MRVLRVIVPVLAAVAAVLALAPAAAASTAAASRSGGSTVSVETVSADIRGLEYAARLTEGRFGGAATGAVTGGWLATVVHDPLRAGRAVPITGGSFRLHGAGGDLGGTFVGGSVTPLGAASACGDERFRVQGTLDLDDGASGSFAVVLTHLRVRTDDGCRTYGALVAGSLTVPSDAVAV